MASDIVLNFLLSTKGPVLSCNQADIFGCNVMESLSLLTSFSNLGMIAYESTKKHINIVNKITYKYIQNNMKDGDVMNEGEQL